MSRPPKYQPATSDKQILAHLSVLGNGPDIVLSNASAPGTVTWVHTGAGCLGTIWLQTLPYRGSLSWPTGLSVTGNVCVQGPMNDPPGYGTPYPRDANITLCIVDDSGEVFDVATSARIPP